jgi:hypothetical protein
MQILKYFVQSYSTETSQIEATCKLFKEKGKVQMGDQGDFPEYTDPTMPALDQQEEEQISGQMEYKTLGAKSSSSASKANPKLAIPLPSNSGD